MSAFFFTVAVLGYANAASVAAYMGDGELTASLEAAFLIFLLVPFLAVGRGVFQGKEGMKVSAISQMIEQFVRVTGILLVSVAAYTAGDVYLIGRGTAAAVFMGMLLAGVYLGWQWKQVRLWTIEGKGRGFFYARRILGYSLLIGVSYMLMLFLQLADAFTFVPLLNESGIRITEAREWKGVYDRAQPLIQLVLVLASSIALSLLPSVIRPEDAERAIPQAVTITVLFSTAAFAGLFILFPEINRLFYLDTSGTGVLRLQMINVVFISLAVTLSSALQGMGEVRRTAVVISAGLVVKLVMNLLLIPEFHTYGAAVSSVLAALFIVIIQIWILKRRLHSTLFLWRRGRLFPALLGMTAVVGGMQSLYSPEDRLVLLGWVLLMSGIGALLYILLLRQFRTVAGAFVPSEFRKWLVKEES
ncbi:polysaccharide biosynthesis C-terminal domain-containing protein [Salimicrobium sp. PL1-032A]|uniref:oligosaccharide flippase family protein n=1 Tax=Salimicrobium sp. PL1-032A TaxID=3095364 RepID=UPI0032619B63